MLVKITISKKKKKDHFLDTLHTTWNDTQNHSLISGLNELAFILTDIIDKYLRILPSPDDTDCHKRT